MNSVSWCVQCELLWMATVVCFSQSRAFNKRVRAFNTWVPLSHVVGDVAGIAKLASAARHWAAYKLSVRFALRSSRFGCVLSCLPGAASRARGLIRWHQVAIGILE